MRLTVKLYVEDWSYIYEHGVIPDNTPAKQIANILNTNMPVVHVAFNFAYWRKANALHNWFVDNVQDGEDDCKPYYVSKSQLLELRDLCNSVLGNNELAEELLPTLDGFFFGDNTYTEDYINDLQYTVEVFKNLESFSEDFTFEYQSSW